MYDAAPAILNELVPLAWSTFVGSGATPNDDRSVPASTICASISINGPRSATLLLFCDHEVARAGTSNVLGVEPADVEMADMFDIIGELANIVGGNLKGAVSDDHTDWALSLPVVSDGMQTVPHSVLTTHSSFTTEWGVLTCHVREHD